MVTLRERLVQVRLNDPLVLGSTLLVLLVLMCTVVVHVEEGWGWLDSIYFSVTSVTTLGDPNFAPSQDATKVFLILYLPLGIGMGFTVLAAFGARVLDTQRRRLERLQKTRASHNSEHNGERREEPPPSS